MSTKARNANATSKGAAGWPSKTGRPSGKGRDNNPPKRIAKGPAGWPSKTGNPSGKRRDNNLPKK